MLEKKLVFLAGAALPPPPPPPAMYGPANTGIFLRGLKRCVSKKKIWGNHAFFRDNKASVLKKNRHTLLCILLFLFRILLLLNYL